MKKEQYLGLPPFDEKAERAVLSAILSRENKFIEVKSKLTTPEHFYVGNHSAIYNAMLQLNKMNQQIDIVNISTYLKEYDLLEVSGGYSYLMDIADEYHAGFRTKDHVNTVEMMYLARQGLNSMALNADLLHEEPSKAEKILADHCSKLSDFLANRETSGLKHCKDALIEVYENFSRIKEGDYSKENELKVNSGFNELDHMLNGFRRGGLYVLAARPAQGKELDVNTKLLTPYGWIKLGDAQLGEQIIGSDGKSHNITGVFPQGMKDVYRIHFDDGTSIDSGLEHQWEVTTRATRKAKKPAIVVKTKDMLNNVALPDRRKNYAIKINKPVEFSHQRHPLPCDPWLMGIYLGDGYSHGSSACFSNSENDIIHRINSHLPFSDMLNKRAKNDKYNYIVVRKKYNKTRSDFLEIVINLGLKSKKSYEKFIPYCFLHSSVENRIKLLQGLVDSDGFVVTAGRNHIEYCTASEQLCEDILFLVRSLGGKASFKQLPSHYVKDGKKIQCKDKYRITFSMGADITPCSSVKHLKKYSRIKRYHNKYITKIEKLDKQKEMLCISVDAPDRLYIVEGFNLTHNSACIVNIATNVAKYEKKAVAIFSLEMTEKEIMGRIVCAEAEVGMKKLQFNATTEAEFKRFSDKSATVGTYPIFIDDKDISSVAKIKAKLQALKQKQKDIGLVVIDYLQLMQGDDPKEQNIVTIIDKITRDLKRMAVDFNVPVVILSQLSREVEKRNNKRPMLSDLRSSGQIEANANVVMFLYRHEYYEPDDADPGHAELIIAKNRGGNTGTIELFFDAKITKFSALERN